MAYFYAGSHGRPSWRKAGQHEGFRIVAVKSSHVRRLSRHTGQVWVPKAGWVRFRWSRAVPEVKSYRVTRDRAGRWHIAFAAIPQPIPGPGTSQIVGIDRGVSVSAALSNGQLLRCPGLRRVEQARLRRLQRQLARAADGSGRRQRVKVAIAKLRARERDRRKDWAEKTSTDLARRFDLIRVEDLRIPGMIRSARGTSEEPGQGGSAEGRAEPGHPGFRMGPAGAPTAGKGARPGGEDQPRVHQSALLGVRVRRSREPREPSPLPLRGLRLRQQR
jgi:putative transposase